MFGLGVNRLGASRSLLGDAIANLFSNGEQGVWYDPSDLTTMRQTGASGLPAIIGQPVGLMFDKSQGVKLGSELITNGDFAADSNWVKGNGWSISGGVGVANIATGGNLRQNGVALEENKVYSITFTIVSISAGAVLGRFGGTPAVDSVSFNQVGTYTFFLKANSTNSSFMLRGQGGFTGTVDNVSVKEVLGNHAIQTTSVNRPVLARHPEGGIRNLLSYTQEFDDNYWTKADATVTANQIAAPDGTNTGDKVNENAATTPHYIYQTGFTFTSGEEYTQSVYAKAGTNNIVQLLGTTAAFGSQAWANFDLSDGTIGSKGTATAAAIQSVGEGWYRCSITITATITSGGSAGLTALVPTKTSSRIFSYEGNPSNHIYAWGAQVELGSTATQYQHVTDDLRYDITEPFGANSLNYLKFNGVDDGMSLTGLTSPSTPITAWFGYSATNAESSDLKALIDIQTGRTILGASATGTNQVGYYDTGTGLWRGFATDANALKVLTYDLVEDNAKMRVDGIQEYSDTTYDQLAIGGQIGLFASYPLTAYRLGGNLYSCILRAAESTDKEIASTESYVAKKTGLLAQVDGLATLSLDFGGNTYTARNSNGGIL